MQMKGASIIVVFVALALCSCQPKKPPSNEGAPQPAKVAAEAPQEQNLLSRVGREFAKGVSADDVVNWAGAEAAKQEGNVWLVSAPKARMSFELVAPTTKDASSWIIGRPLEGEQDLRLRDLVDLFGPYRKLPPGEYTWLRFEAFNAPHVSVSAMVSLLPNEPDSPVLRVQFQQAL